MMVARMARGPVPLPGSYGRGRTPAPQSTQQQQQPQQQQSPQQQQHEQQQSPQQQQHEQQMQQLSSATITARAASVSVRAPAGLTQNVSTPDSPLPPSLRVRIHPLRCDRRRPSLQAQRRHPSGGDYPHFLGTPTAESYATPFAMTAPPAVGRSDVATSDATAVTSPEITCGAADGEVRNSIVGRATAAAAAACAAAAHGRCAVYCACHCCTPTTATATTAASVRF